MYTSVKSASCISHALKNRSNLKHIISCCEMMKYINSPEIEWISIKMNISLSIASLRTRHQAKCAFFQKSFVKGCDCGMEWVRQQNDKLNENWEFYVNLNGAHLCRSIYFSSTNFLSWATYIFLTLSIPAKMLVSFRKWRFMFVEMLLRRSNQYIFSQYKLFKYSTKTATKVTQNEDGNWQFKLYLDEK